MTKKIFNGWEDVTFQFFFEGERVSSVESFRTGQPGLFALESIEPCVIYSISKKDFQSKGFIDKVIFPRRGVRLYA